MITNFRIAVTCILMWSVATTLPVDSLKAQEKSPELISLVTSGSAKTMLGELARENQSHIELLDLKTGQLQIFSKSDVKTIRRGVAERTVIDSVGLANYMAWRIKKVLPLASATGKVAQIDGAVVYVSIGSNLGVEVGDEFVVYRGVADIKDPDTGKILGQQRRKIATLHAVEVEQQLTKCKLIGDLDIPIELGDVAQPAFVANSVAVLPLVNDQGNETVTSKRIAGELTTGLVNRGVRVVERRAAGADPWMGAADLQVRR